MAGEARSKCWGGQSVWSVVSGQPLEGNSQRWEVCSFIDDATAGAVCGL